MLKTVNWITSQIVNPSPVCRGFVLQSGMLFVVPALFSWVLIDITQVRVIIIRTERDEDRSSRELFVASHTDGVIATLNSSLSSSIPQTYCASHPITSFPDKSESIHCVNLPTRPLPLLTLFYKKFVYLRSL